jgi:hypothetical protein
MVYTKPKQINIVFFFMTIYGIHVVVQFYVGVMSEDNICGTSGTLQAQELNGWHGLPTHVMKRVIFIMYVVL